jgi:putative salt-induced outer membrane protein YdiY
MRTEKDHTERPMPRFIVGAVCALATCIGTGVSQAVPTNHWESVAAVGVALTRGNSENFLVTASINTARKWSKDEVLLGASAGYGETTSEVDNQNPPPATKEDHTTTAQYVKGFGQWNHLITERFYVGLRLDGVYDQVAGIDYRFTVNPLAGYYLIKKPNMFLALEAGPSFVAENLAGDPATQYLALRFAERFEYKFPGDRARFWQSVEWFPRVDDFHDWFLNFEAGIAATIVKPLELRLVAYDNYDNVPAQGRKNNDFKLTAQLGYKF